MEVTSGFLETADMRLHITTFTPPNVSNQDVGVIFAGYQGRFATIDSFGAAYIVAAEGRMPVCAIDLPGKGSSPLPECPILRADYRKFGFVGIRDAVVATQSTDEVFKGASRVHATGLSQGGAQAVMYLAAQGDRAASAMLIDSGGMRSRANKFFGGSIYSGYIAAQTIAGKLNLKPTIESLYAHESEIMQAYNLFLKQNPKVKVNPEMSPESRKIEMAELARLAEGRGVAELIALMEMAIKNEAPLEVRVSRSPIRKFTDKASVEVINQALDNFDTANRGQTFAQCGFLQTHDYPWHDLAFAPNAVRDLTTRPFDSLSPRLK